MNRVRLSLVLSSGLLLGGCSFIPVLHKPAPPVAEQWGASGVVTSPAAELLRWQQYFPDERLQGLIRASLAHNRDLRVAILNIEQARAQLTVQRADLFPTLNASVNATRQPSSSAPYQVGTVASGGLALASFELDLFGRVRALSEAASAQLLGTQASSQTTQISLVASVASAYYSLWADRWQQALVDQTLATREASLKLLKLKYDAGVLNELEWRSAQSQVEAARISRAQVQRQWQQDLNALSLLIGQPVAASMLPPVPSWSTRAVEDVDALPRLDRAALWPVLSEVPVGLPSEVLLKRPDIIAAEQALVAANANIGAARAARFPRISLTGSAGVVSDSLSGLFSDGRSAWSVGGGLVAPLLDAGRSSANVTASEVRRDVAVAQYEKAIQVAFREVSDALVARSTWGDQVQAQQAQADAEADRLKLSALRYRTGVASQLDLLDAQRNLFAAQQALINAELARQQSHIAVFKALGGGVDAPAAP